MHVPPRKQINVRLKFFSGLISLYGDHNWEIYLLWAHKATVPSPPTDIRSSYKTRVSTLFLSTANAPPPPPALCHPNHPQSLFAILPCLRQSSDHSYSLASSESVQIPLSEWSSPCTRPITHQNSWGQSTLKVSILRTLRPQTPKSSGNLAVRYTWLSRDPCFSFLHAPRGEDAGTADGRAHVAERAVILIAGARRLHVQCVQ